MRGKVKAVLPSLKEKKRYILFEIIFLDGKIQKSEVINEFKRFLMSFLGIFHYSLYGIFEIEELRASNFFVLRVKSHYKDYVIFASTFFKKKGVLVLPVRTFGTLRKIKEFLTNHDIKV